MLVICLVLCFMLYHDMFRRGMIGRKLAIKRLCPQPVDERDMRGQIRLGGYAMRLRTDEREEIYDRIQIGE